MKNEVLAYASVAAISLIAGVGIAGLPDSSSGEVTIVAPETTTTTTIVEAPSTTIAPAVDEAPTSSSSTTTVATVASTSTTTTVPLADRSTLGVVAVNGAGVGGLAGRTRTTLLDLGYTQTRPADGLEIVDESTVYFFDGFEREAAVLAAELDIDLERVISVFGAPAYGVQDGDEVVVYLGRDKA